MTFVTTNPEILSSFKHSGTQMRCCLLSIYLLKLCLLKITSLVVFESLFLYSLLLCLNRLLCPGLLGVCHTSRKHLSHCSVLWNFNTLRLFCTFVKCFPSFRILLNIQNNLMSCVIFLNYVSWEPRIQIFKWFSQVNTSKWVNFILLMT